MSRFDLSNYTDDMKNFALGTIAILVTAWLCVALVVGTVVLAAWIAGAVR